MSNLEGENPEFEEFDLSAEDLSQPEGEPRKPDESDQTLLFEGAGEDMLQPSDDMLQPGEDMLQPGEEGLESGLADETVLPADETPQLAEADGLADLGVAEPAAVEEKAEEEPEEEEKEPGFIEKLTKTSPYVVLLGISAAAIMIAIVYLFLELREYDFQVKPTQAGMAPAVQSGPPSTTATA